MTEQETWFIDTMQRLTGETSPRNEQALVWRDLLENAGAVRAAMRYSGTLTNLTTAEKNAIGRDWMLFIAALRSDMYQRSILQAPGVENLSFSQAGTPERLIPTFALGTWASERTYVLTPRGDPRHDAIISIEPPAGVIVTVGEVSNTEGSNLSITRAKPAQVEGAVSEYAFQRIVVEVSLKEGSEAETRFNAGEPFQILIGNTITQNMRLGVGVPIVVFYN